MDSKYKKIVMTVGIVVGVAGIAGGEMAPIICRLEYCHIDQPHTHQESKVTKDFRAAIHGSDTTISAGINYPDLS